MSIKDLLFVFMPLILFLPFFILLGCFISARIKETEGYRSDIRRRGSDHE